MKFSTLLFPVLAAVAMAAPAPAEGNAIVARNDQVLGAEAGSLNDLFKVEGDVLVGPDGYFDKDGFHPGEYKAAAKRELDERVFLSKGLHILGPGWRVRYGVLIGPNAWWDHAGYHWGPYPYHRGWRGWY